jgi:hypothetical protein
LANLREQGIAPTKAMQRPALRAMSKRIQALLPRSLFSGVVNDAVFGCLFFGILLVMSG